MNINGILIFNHDHNILLHVSYIFMFCQKKCQNITVEVKLGF